MEEGGFARILGGIGPTNKFAYFPLIFQSFAQLEQKMPRTLPMMANCLKMEHFDNNGNNWLCHQFHPEQVDFICQCLFQWGEGERLVRMFMLNQDLLNPCVRSSTVLKAYLFALYHQGLFDTLFQVMAENRFDHSHHPELVQLWYSARYEEERKRKVKELVPVDKYRIRKKFPPPKSIWDGDELVYSFRKGDRKILKEFYERNRYPSAEDKREIGRRTGLSTTQIANWFKNRRQREKTGEPGSNY